MFVPMSVNDFIDRAAAVYGERLAVVDEPDQPAPPLEGVTYARMRQLANAQAAHLDSLGIDVGDRVAVVSHNSARLLTSFFGVAGSGRVLVPINFRLAPEEVKFIVEHSGARVLYIDPELTALVDEVSAEHTFVLGEDEHLFGAGADGTPAELTGALQGRAVEVRAAQPRKAQRKEMAALGRNQRVQLVEDHRLQIGKESFRVLGCDQQRQLLGRREEDVRRTQLLALATVLAGIAGARLDLDPEAHLFHRGGKIALDVRGERLEWRDVERVDAGCAGARLARRAARQVHQRR